MQAGLRLTSLGAVPIRMMRPGFSTEAHNSIQLLQPELQQDACIWDRYHLCIR
jgi:hypothetical protein